MTKYIGDFAAGVTVRGSFSTRKKADGAPITLAGSPTLAVYKDGNATETTTGVALTIDFDSRTGHHLYAITTTDAFYSAGSDYRIVLTAGTVDGESVVGVEVGSFSIENRFAPSGSGLDAAGVRSAIGLASANLDTQLGAIPTAAANASQVRTELTTELARIDATISSRSTFAGGAVASVTGAVGSVTSPVTVGTNNDKTGYSLSQAFPANFAALGINPSGHVSRVVLVDTTTTNSDMRGTDSALLASGYTAPANSDIAAILADTNELQSEWANGGRLDSILDARASQVSVDTIDGIVDQILVDTGTTIPAAIAGIEGGTGATAEEVWEYPERTLTGIAGTCASLATRTIDDETPLRFVWPTANETIIVERSINDAAFEAADGTATFFRTEGLQHWYTLSYNVDDREVGIVRYRLTQGSVVKFMTLQVLGDVSVDVSGLATLAKQDEILGAIGDIEGGGSSVNVLPAVGIVADRSPGATITPVVGETISQSITLYATDGTTPINLSGKTLAIVFETLQGVDVAVVASGSITISGSNSNVVTFAYPSVVTASERTLRFAIRDAAAPLALYLQGLCVVTRAPQVD